MTYRKVVGLLAVMLFGGLLASWCLGADAEPAGLAAFGGQRVIVRSRGASRYASYLEQVTLRKLGNEPFVVGTGLDLGEDVNWQAGLEVWIPLSDVGHVVVLQPDSQLPDFPARLRTQTNR